jgi:hypothetical protein
VESVAPLAREAALPSQNFNVAARDRRFLSRLAVPPFLGRMNHFFIMAGLAAPGEALA